MVDLKVSSGSNSSGINYLNLLLLVVLGLLVLLYIYYPKYSPYLKQFFARHTKNRCYLCGNHDELKNLTYTDTFDFLYHKTCLTKLIKPKNHYRSEKHE